jgi:hypothetical protein
MEKTRIDLTAIRDDFVEIGEIAEHKLLRLSEIEDQLEPVRTGEEKFSRKHLEIIKDPEGRYWKFLTWWKIPDLDEAQYELIGDSLARLDPNKKTLVTRLNNFIKNIEIVSCILRFVDPIHYGILSPPVETLLGVKGDSSELKYFNYLENLKELQKEYDFLRIADVDMALWALACILNRSELRQIPKFKDYYEQYRKSVNPIKLLMAKNSLEQIWTEKGYLNIAELFLETDHKVAGILASRELERMVKENCVKYGIELYIVTSTPRHKHEYREFMELAGDLSKKVDFVKYYLDEIRKWRRIRADLLHEIDIDIASEDIVDMIKGMKELSVYLNL